MVIRTKLKKNYKKNNNIIKQSFQLIQIVSYSKFIKEKKIDWFSRQPNKVQKLKKNNNNQTNKPNNTITITWHMYTTHTLQSTTNERKIDDIERKV